MQQSNLHSKLNIRGESKPIRELNSKEILKCQSPIDQSPPTKISRQYLHNRSSQKKKYGANLLYGSYAANPMKEFEFIDLQAQQANDAQHYYKTNQAKNKYMTSNQQTTKSRSIISSMLSKKVNVPLNSNHYMSNNGKLESPTSFTHQDGFGDPDMLSTH